MNSDLILPHSNDTALQFASFFEADWQPYFYILWQRLQDGHICVPRSEVTSQLRAAGLREGMTDVNESEFISDGGVIRPIVAWNDKLYLHRYFKYETIILDKIRMLMSGRTDAPRGDSFQFDRAGETDWQQVAAAACLLNNFTIVTGGPGTGKTTTVASILKILLGTNPAYKVALAAPTGKAAARMAESLKEKASGFDETLKALFSNIEPSTIHRLLGSRKNHPAFKHNANNPLDFDIIIIDESSMLDVALFARLLDAVSPDTRLILLGDKNQLASVEAGSLFGDLCSVPEKLNVFSEGFAEKLVALSDGPNGLPTTKSRGALSDHIVELQKSFRFSTEAGIGKLSKIIIEEDLQALDAFLERSDDVVAVDTTYNEDLFEKFIEKFKGYLAETDILTALKKLNDCRVLCAVKDGRFGLHDINRRIENTLEKKKWIKRDRPFYINRPVIITKNNYQLGLFNGDSGIVRKDENGNIKVWFDINGELTGFAPALITGENTAFALTIHKSQGSEFDEVLIVLPDYEVPVLSKELIYTGITRAKKHVLLQAERGILQQTIQRSVKRGSGLKDRF